MSNHIQDYIGKECPTKISSNEKRLGQSKIKIHWLEILHLRKIFVCKSWLYLDPIRSPVVCYGVILCIDSESEASRRYTKRRIVRYFDIYVMNKIDSQNHMSFIYEKDKQKIKKNVTHCIQIILVQCHVI